MYFIDVANVFDQIEQISSRLEITAILADLFAEATPVEASIISYLSLGDLNPVYVGTQFNLAEKSIIKVVAKLLDESAESITRRAKKVGDLGLVLEAGLEGKRVRDHRTLKEVYRDLQEIHDIAGVGSQEKKGNALRALLKTLDPKSGKYIAKIIVGKLRLGFSDMTLLDAFSWMVTGDKSLRQPLENAYNVSADIGLIVKTLKEEGIEGIKQMRIIPGIPIRPASAERLANADAIIKKLGACVAQPKLDGFRLQVHGYPKGKKHAVRFFSRHLQDMSDMFPELTEAVAQLKIKEFVAEGEAIAYDLETDTFLSFQETVKRKRKHEVAAFAKDFPLKLYLFDLLYLNGKSLLDLPHKERRKILSDVIPAPKKTKNIIYVVEEQRIKTPEELEDYFNDNVTAGLEGLVVKKPDAPYQAGKRNFNWIKLKRQESGHLEDTLDCVILGYYAGHGKRAAFGIGAFLVGVFNPKEDRFETVAKIGTGLTDAGWKELKKRCDKVSVSRKPKNVECVKDLAPDVWCAPEIVCAIRADEITLSPVHSAGATPEHLGYALRFPRFMIYREDKGPEEATTIKEVKQLYDIQFEKEKRKVKKKKK